MAGVVSSAPAPFLLGKGLAHLHTEGDTGGGDICLFRKGHFCIKILDLWVICFTIGFQCVVSPGQVREIRGLGHRKKRGDTDNIPFWDIFQTAGGWRPPFGRSFRGPKMKGHPPLASPVSNRRYRGGHYAQQAGVGAVRLRLLMSLPKSPLAWLKKHSSFSRTRGKWANHFR